MISSSQSGLFNTGSLFNMINSADLMSSFRMWPIQYRLSIWHSKFSLFNMISSSQSGLFNIGSLFNMINLADLISSLSVNLAHSI